MTPAPEPVEQSPRRRRVVVVEYDVTRLAAEQVDDLPLRVLVGDQDVSFRIKDAPWRFCKRALQTQTAS